MQYLLSESESTEFKVMKAQYNNVLKLLDEYVKLCEDIAACMLAWPQIEKCLQDYAVYTSIRGGKLPVIPEIVAMKELYERRTKDAKNAGN